MRKTELGNQFKNDYLLGLAENCNRNRWAVKTIENAKQLKRSRRIEFDIEYEIVCEKEKEKIAAKHTENIQFDIRDFIRNWFQEMYNVAGEFDEYPAEAKGGSIPIMMGETKTEQEFLEYVASKSAKRKNKKEVSTMKDMFAFL